MPGGRLHLSTSYPSWPRLCIGPLPILVPMEVLVVVPTLDELFVVAPVLVLLLSSQWLCAHEVPTVHPTMEVESSLHIPHLLHHPHPPMPTLPVEVPLAL